jgi:ribosomal protein L16 Arg81 hydroxylase
MIIENNIHVVDGLINKRVFDRQLFKYHQPVLFKNMVGAMGSDLSLELIESRFGEAMVPFYDNRNKTHNKGAVTVPDGQISLKNFISHIRLEEKSHIRIFLLDLFGQIPALKNHFRCPDFFSNPLDGKAFWFFGGRNTEVKVHYDIDCSGVLMTQFSGRKKVILVAPKFSDMMYRLPLNVHSLTGDLTDEKNFPALRHVHASSVIMEPGDALYMPPKYWHYNTYLDPGFAISYRCLSPNPLHWLEGIMNLGIRMPLDKTLLRLAGDKWFEWKQEFAASKAENSIRVHKKHVWA